jgi:hypothetical protein
MERFLIKKKRRVEIGLPNEMWEKIVLFCSWPEYYFLRQTCLQLYKVCQREKVRHQMEAAATNFLVDFEIFLTCSCRYDSTWLNDNPHPYVPEKCYPFIHFTAKGIYHSKGLRSTRIDKEAKKICEFDMQKTNGGCFVFINLLLTFLNVEELEKFPNIFKRYAIVKNKTLGKTGGPIPLHLKND